ncbi:MAG: DUF445 domain-containing protein [Nocardioidaceae bacterium]|nr:DUF445 domain-containing protein [Nocardioidaceae bacterium]
MALPDGWWVYVAMPLFMALIGYVTKLLAIRMMFEPLEYRGWGPFGWQGVIPRRAARMAAVACDLITTRLIGPRDILDRLDPDKVAAELEAPLLSAVDEITREVMTQFQPGLWETLPESSRLLLIRRIQAEAPEVIADLLRDIRADVDQVFDLKTMVVTNLVRDKHLLNRIFAEAGEEEFRFIARSGIWFGFGIGCVQAVTWALTHSPWILPLFGAFTGWFTDWLALKLIFYPKQPRGFGWLRWQGLFLARRERVTERYAALIAQELITPHNLFEALLHGPLADRVFAMVQRHVQRAVDAQTGVARPLVVLAVGSSHYQDIKRAVAEQVMERLPTTLAYVEDYTAEALDIKATLVRKMRQLTDEEFEQLIRPAFQADEWILITVGAVLGFSMGELQVLALERFA